MGKVKDGTPASKAPKPSKGGAFSENRRRVASFFANFLSAAVYKPLQGWYARLYTAIGLGAVIGLGLWRLYDTLIVWDNWAVRAGVPAALAALSGWIIYRLVQYPPFVDFLIATEAEMNKISWTSRDDLRRATSVVLVTVVLMSVFLFGVDWLWSNLLQVIGVLKFGGGGGFGSNA